MSEDYVSKTSDKILITAGATSSILLMLLLASWLNLIPDETEGIILAVGLFISLPLVFSFIFGLIIGTPNFGSTLRHYGFGLYLLISLVIYFLYLRPDSFMVFGKYLVQFFLGFILAFIIGLVYLTIHYALRKHKYRVKASISFIIALVFSIIMIFILKHYNVFDWMT